MSVPCRFNLFVFTNLPFTHSKTLFLMSKLTSFRDRLAPSVKDAKGTFDGKRFAVLASSSLWARFSSLSAPTGFAAPFFNAPAFFDRLRPLFPPFFSATAAA